MAFSFTLSLSPQQPPFFLASLFVPQKTGKFFYSNGVLVRDSVSGAVKFSYKWGGRVAFVLATTSMVTFMPLLFEIAREQQVRRL
jgi:hypothetical protein